MYSITVRETGYEVKLADEQDVGKQVATYERLSRTIGEKAAKVIFVNVIPVDGSEVMRVESTLLLIRFYWTKDEVKVRTFADLERDLLASKSEATRWGVEKRLWLTLTDQNVAFMNELGILRNGGLIPYVRSKRSPKPIQKEYIDDEEIVFFRP